MKNHYTLKLILAFFLVIFLIVWIYGNSIEKGDMSNSGYQVFGFLGVVGFGLANIIYYLMILRNKKN